MGCSRSRIYHEQEKGIPHKDLIVAKFEIQNEDLMRELETDNDQKGRVAVDCIFRPTREVYGQPADDMIEQYLEWDKYGIIFDKRPFPHDFPAFAHEKPAIELAELHQLGVTATRLKKQRTAEKCAAPKTEEVEDVRNI